MKSALTPPASHQQHIVVATYGTLGDVYPFLQLARTLQARGHRVTVVSSAFHRERIEANGLSFAPIRPDVSDLNISVDEFAHQMMDPRRGAKFIYHQVLIPALRHSYDDLLAITQDADLLISHPLLLAAPLVAEKTGLRWISTVLAPLSFLSCHDPSVLTADSGPDPQKLPVFVNRLLRWLVQQSVRSWETPIQRFRRSLHLPAGGHPLFGGQHAPDRALALFSAAFARPQPDWPAQARATGFIFYQHEPAAPVPPAVEAFLAAGPAPVVFTLGSSAVFTARTFFQESLAAMRRLGGRAVFITGGISQQGLEADNLGESMLVIDYIPHDYLFSRAAIVVHQGGIGTTAQALRAGCPMLVVPHAHDQPDNAVRVTRLGVGRLLTPERYIASQVAIELTMLQQAIYRQRAAELADQLRAEDGASTACDLIEAQLPLPA